VCACDEVAPVPPTRRLTASSCSLQQCSVFDLEHAGKTVTNATALYLRQASLPDCKTEFLAKAWGQDRGPEQVWPEQGLEPCAVGSDKRAFGFCHSCAQLLFCILSLVHKIAAPSIRTTFLFQKAMPPLRPRPRPRKSGSRHGSISGSLRHDLNLTCPNQHDRLPLARVCWRRRRRRRVIQSILQASYCLTSCCAHPLYVTSAGVSAVSVSGIVASCAHMWSQTCVARHATGSRRGSRDKGVCPGSITSCNVMKRHC
jgi:hypothetical protein